MIIDLYKYVFLGAKDRLDLFFQRAQKEGIVQFLARSPKKGAALPPDIQGIIDALKLLRKQPVKKPYSGEYSRDEAETFVDRILELRREIEKFEDERSHLESEIARVFPLGDFRMEDITYLEKEAGLKVQFFCVKSKRADKMRISSDLIYIDTEYDLDYFFTLNKEKKSFPSMIEVHLEKTAGELRTHLGFVKEGLHELEAELKGFAGHIPYLRRYLVQQLNDHHRYEAKRGVDFPLEDALFSVEGWVPKNKVQQLKALIQKEPVVYERIAIDKKDRKPTYMENKGINHIGEDLVNIYDTPAPEDRDPSPWLYWFFALFFAIIVADGGYGFLYLGFALFLKFKLPDLKGKAQRLYRLLLTLSISCVIWGVIAGSFFGIRFRPDNILSKASLFHYLAEKKAEYHLEHKDDVYADWVKKIPALKGVRTGQEFLEKGSRKLNGKEQFVVQSGFEDNIFLEISLLLGVIHICLSLLRYVRRNWASFGWFLALIGGYFYFPLFLNATSLIHFLGIVQKTTVEHFGAQLMMSGVGLAVVLALFQKRLRGIGEIANLVQLFGDVLSYLRLYALGLAGSIMAQTINDLGDQVGLFFGVLVILAGHSINITLGIMSGVIHGLRLNFIEWYHYSYIGGGKLFNPLRKLKLKS